MGKNDNNEIFLKIQRLIKEDEAAALKSFRTKDFPGLLAGEIKSRGRKGFWVHMRMRKPWLAMSATAALAVIGAAVAAVMFVLPHRNDDVDKIRNFLLKIPAFQYRLNGELEARSPMSVEQIHLLELDWFFRNAFYSLHRRELSKIQLQGLLCRALESETVPGQQERTVPHAGKNLRELRLEERIQKLKRENKIHYWLKLLSTKSKEV